MAVSHVKSDTIADFTGTITGFNSQGSTTTIAATNLVRPSDWNSAHNQFYTLTGNTNNASTASGTNVVFGATGDFTIVGSTGSIMFSAPPAETATMWFPYNEAVNMTVAPGQGSFGIAPVPTPVRGGNAVLHIDRVAFPVFLSNSSNSTASVTLTFLMGLYTKNASTLSVAHSTSLTTAFTMSGTVNSTTNRGIRLFTIPWTTTINDGRYYVGIGFRSTTGGNNATIQQIGLSQMNSNFSGVFGQGTNRSDQWPLGFGIFSASTTAVPGSIGVSQIDGTGSVAARPPTWFMISGTV